MKIIRLPKDIQQVSSTWRQKGERIGLVPTMGFFHEGHLSLMRRARSCCDKVITTLFVNPMQFGPNEDLDAYPRDFDRDRKLAESEGVDLLFCPEPSAMYGRNFQTRITVEKLSQGLCGADRPGHFDGVATVVTKLFNITNPHVAVFGQKDFQQLALIRQLVKDLNFDVEIIGHPIVREPDGLAMSSRNKYLDQEERQVATCLFAAITEAKRIFQQENERVEAAVIEKAARRIIESHKQCSIEYATVVHRDTLQRVEYADRESVLVLAMKVNGKVRLIDNSPLSDAA